MKHVDICAGIGGFSLAARWCGIPTVGMCEIDPFCQKVLGKNFPGVPIHDDLKTLDPDIVRGWVGGGRYVLTAGYPCQPFSHAGRRGGADDPRHLWPAIRELVAGLGEDRPGWLLLENVVGHVTMGLDDVLADLEGEGYACWAAIAPAAGVGAIHRRDRVWIVAARPDAPGQGHHRGVIGTVAEPRYGGRTLGKPERLGNGALLAGRHEGVAESPVRDQDDGIPGRLAGHRGVDGGFSLLGSGREREVAMTTVMRSPHWSSQIKALGNAVVPQVAAVFFESILSAEESS